MGGFFLINKINDFRANMITDVELIKVEYGLTQSVIGGVGAPILTPALEVIYEYD